MHVEARADRTGAIDHDGLLPRLIEALLDGSPAAPHEAEVDGILGRADEFGVFPLIYQRLRDTGLQLSPAGHERWRSHLIWIRLLCRRLQRIVEALDDVQHVVLKGLPLAVTAYGKLQARDVRDVDVLVRAADVPRVRTRLAQLGYAAPSDARPWFGGNNQLALCHQEHGLVVDLHWALALPSVPCPNTDELLRRRVSRRLDEGFFVNTLDAQSSLLNLIYHYHHHLGSFRALFDIAAWLDREAGAVDPTELVETCRQLGIHGLLQWPLHTLRSLTGHTPALLDDAVEPPVRLWSRFTAVRTQGLLASARPRTIEGARRFTQRQRLGQRMAWRLLSASLLDGFRPKAIGVLRPVFHGPAAHAEYRGEPHVTWRTYASMLSRPWVLARKRWGKLS